MRLPGHLSVRRFAGDNSATTVPAYSRCCFVLSVGVLGLCMRAFIVHQSIVRSLARPLVIRTCGDLGSSFVHRIRIVTSYVVRCLEIRDSSRFLACIIFPFVLCRVTEPVRQATIIS